MTAIRVGAGSLLFVCLASGQFGWLHGNNKLPHKKKETPDEAILGVVVRKAPDSFVIRAVDTRFITYKIDDVTVYFHGSKWSGPSLLKRGAAVKVEASSDKDGNLTANNVIFQDSQPELKSWTSARDLLPGGVADDPLVSSPCCRTSSASSRPRAPMPAPTIIGVPSIRSPPKCSMIAVTSRTRT
jgi:hypothetical protein